MGVDYGDRKEYVAGGDIWEALARTLIIDRTAVDKNELFFDYQRDHLEEGSSTETAPLHEEFSGFREHMLSSLSPSCKVDDEASQKSLTIITYEQLEYFSRIVAHSRGRSFYITMKGYIGLGPKEMKPGDVVCVLAGSSVPYVMRPQRDEFCMIGENSVAIRREAYVQMPDGDHKPYILRSQEHKYRLIGECYSHGLMHGEVWDLSHAFFEDFRLI